MYFTWLKYICGICTSGSRWEPLSTQCDIKNNNISKSWNVPVPALKLGFYVHYSQLEGGQSNRLAVVSREDTHGAEVLHQICVYNIENGDCVFSLDFDEPFTGYSIKFHLGKLILIKVLQSRFQIIIIDEKAKTKNQVVVGASWDDESSNHVGEFCIGSKSMICLNWDHLNHLKFELSNTWLYCLLRKIIIRK